MLIFSDRKKLDEKYKEWLTSEPWLKIEDNSSNVLTFLVSKNLLDEDKVRKFLEINNEMLDSNF